MRTAVDKVHKVQGRTVNARFADMCAHYLYDPDFCNVASGWEKGVVEKNDAKSRVTSALAGASSPDIKSTRRPPLVRGSTPIISTRSRKLSLNRRYQGRLLAFEQLVHAL